MLKIKMKVIIPFVLGIMALSQITLAAQTPVIIEIDVHPGDPEYPSGELVFLEVYLNTSTGQLSVETNVNQWMWVYILDADTGVVYSIDYIDPSLNYGNVYTTNAPSLPGNYCVYFQSGTTIAMGYFTIQ